MSITINGAGSITGLSTGGLPDGSVATDDLAANAVTAGKLATTLDLTGKTVTLPAGVGGKVLQVVSGITPKTSDISTSSNSYADSGLFNVSITPVAAGSKFFVCFSGYHPHIHPGNNNYGCAYKIYRNINSAGDTATSTNHIEGYYQASGTFGQWFDYTGCSTILDTPSYSLGNTIVYKLFARKTNNTVTGYVHHTGGIAAQTDSPNVVHTIMEIAG